MKKISLILALMMSVVVVMCGCENNKSTETETVTENETTSQTNVTTESQEESTTEKAIESTAQTEESEMIVETEEIIQPDQEDLKIQYLMEVQDTDQMIFIIGTGDASDATMYFYEKTDGVWNLLYSCNACVGQNGFSYSTYEGDRTTPCGTFNVGVSFGIQSNPGTALDWFDVDDGDVWVDDINSEYYNQLIDKYETPDGWESGEHLIDYTGPYAYAFNIEVNPPYQTSAIFFHCFGPNHYTGGCVGVSEDDCIWVLQNVRPGAQITIVPCEEDLAELG